MRFLTAAVILTILVSAAVLADGPAKVDDPGLVGLNVEDQADASKPAPVVVEVELGQAGLMGTYLSGAPYKVSVEAYNSMDEPVQNPTILLVAGGTMPIAVKEEDGALPPVINATTRIRKNFTITFPEDISGSGVPLVGTVRYEWKGVEYSAECRLNVQVTSAIEANVMPRKSLASETKQIGVSIINHTEADRKVTVTFQSPDGIKLQPATAEMELAASGLDAKVFTVSADPTLPAGSHEVKLLVDGKQATSFVLDVPAGDQKSANEATE